ncbi:MAG: hypothetical protein Q7T05_08395 [Dehalococcoidia bacterium]|nr:hypothetical protein [Dehalococcoidia bacterium]
MDDVSEKAAGRPAGIQTAHEPAGRLFARALRLCSQGTGAPYDCFGTQNPEGEPACPHDRPILHCDRRCPLGDVEKSCIGLCGRLKPAARPCLLHSELRVGGMSEEDVEN